MGLSAKQIHLGNKLLVYISCCLARRAYPYGDVPQDAVAKVKYDIYSCLTTPRVKKKKVDTSAESETAFPHLKTLLKFDTQGLLNVVSIAFEEPEFNGEMGTCQKQRLVDILLRIMVPPPPSPASTPEKTVGQIGSNGTSSPQRQDSYKVSFHRLIYFTGREF